MRIISHDSSLLENYFFWLVKFSKIRQTFFAKYPNILIEQHLSISLIFTTIISSHHPLSIIITEYARATLRQKPRYRVFPITRRHLSSLYKI